VNRPHIVVTGAGGFVGNFLARWLAKHDVRVTALKRQPETSSHMANLTWRQGDLTQPDVLPVAFDCLVHCAAEIPARCPNPALLYERNILAAESTFRQAAAAGARNIVFLSSMSAYGTISVPVVEETTLPDNPDSYGRAKLDTERHLEEMVSKGLPSALSIRLPGTVGRGSHHNFLSDVMQRILRDETVTVRNPEALFNNIVYVGDLAGFLRHWVDMPRPGYVLTNLAASEPLTVGEVVSLLFRYAGKPEQIRFEVSGKQPFLISTERAISLGYAAPSVEASISAMVRDCIAPPPDPESVQFDNRHGR